jgi:hypothetical protein
MIRATLLAMTLATPAMAEVITAHSDTSDQVFRRHMISHSGVSDHPEMTPSGAVW